MDSRTLSALILLNDLRHAAMDAMRQKHKLPSLLLFYSFIDICASLAEEVPARSNRERFENYLRSHSLTNWETFTPYDLWAARSSLLHTYSPLGTHTKRPGRAKPIFYWAWPETKEKVREAVIARGYVDFVLMDVSTIKTIAVGGFNDLWRRVQNEPQFELRFRRNSEHLLKDFRHIQLENELAALENLARMAESGI